MQRSFCLDRERERIREREIKKAKRSEENCDAREKSETLETSFFQWRTSRILGIQTGRCLRKFAAMPVDSRRLRRLRIFTTTSMEVLRSSASQISLLEWRTTARFSGASRRLEPRRFRCWIFRRSTKPRLFSMSGALVSTTPRSLAASKD